MSRAFQAAKELAIKINPIIAANNCEFLYEGNDNEGIFNFRFLGRNIKLSFPDLKSTLVEDGREVPDFVALFYLHHLAKSDGSKVTGNWISYADLPGGLSYVNAFRGYTSNKIINHFNNDLEQLIISAKALRLGEIDLGAEAAYLFNIMPKVKIAFLYRLGDEEFEPTADFLFDEAASHHLPSDCYAVICSMLTGSLISGKWFF